MQMVLYDNAAYLRASIESCEVHGRRPIDLSYKFIPLHQLTKSLRGLHVRRLTCRLPVENTFDNTLG